MYSKNVNINKIFIVLLFPYLFHMHFGLATSIVTILKSISLRVVALIRGWCLFEFRLLLEQIRQYSEFLFL